MRKRWLDQIVFLERQASRNQRRHYALRRTALVGAVAVPLLVALKMLMADSIAAIEWTALGVSLTVAAAIVLEQRFRYYYRWLNGRQVTEHLKAEGWQFLELAGTYGGTGTHREAFRAFSSAVEDLLVEDNVVHVTEAGAVRADVFISYSRQDSALVHALHAFLLADGWDVWVDFHLNLDAAWEEEVERAVGACAAFVFVISRSSLASEYCLAELDLANERGKRIVPLACENVDSSAVPEPLQARNWVWCRDENERDWAFKELARALDDDVS